MNEKFKSNELNDEVGAADNKTSSSTGKNGKSGTSNRRNGKQKGSKNGRQGKNANKKNSSSVKGVEGLNDPSWLAYNPGLLASAANIPFPSILGIPSRGYNDATIIDGGGSNLPDFIKNQSSWRNIEYTAPGLMGIHFIPSYGRAQSIDDPLNIAAQNIYAYTRKGNSGYANYGSEDQMSLFIGMDSVYSIIAFLKKMYGMSKIYMISNRYAPEAWAKLYRIDITEIQRNQANYLTRLKTLIFRAASISIPDGFKIMDRHEVMNEAFYADSRNLSKAQMYTFIQDGYYMRDDTTGDLNFVDVTGYTTMEEYFDLAERMLQNLLLSEDVAVMTGDIRKAWDKFKMLEDIGEDYVMPIIYDDMIRSQIENIRCIPFQLDSDTIDGLKIKGNATDDLNGYLSVNYTMTLFGQYYKALGASNPAFINLRTENPAPIDIAYATMLTNTVSQIVDTPTGVKLILDNVGSEIVRSFAIVNSVDGGITNFDQFIVRLGEGNDFYNDVIYGDLSAFDWHPILYTMRDRETVDDANLWLTYCDVDNYTYIPRFNLDKMHEVAIYAYFSIPAVGLYRGQNAAARHFDSK